MRPHFTIAQGDTLPVMKVVAEDASGVRLNLAAATGVSAYLLLLPSGLLITLSAAISDPTTGEITVTWQDGDTAVPGQYRLWVVLSFSGKEMTVPSCPDGEDAVRVEVCPR